MSRTIRALEAARDELYSLAGEPVGSGRYKELDEALAEATAEDNGKFGEVAWCDEDIQEAAKQRLNRELTPDELEQTRNSYYCRHISDTMTEQGWEVLYLAVEEFEAAPEHTDDEEEEEGDAA